MPWQFVYEEIRQRACEWELGSIFPFIWSYFLAFWSLESLVSENCEFVHGIIVTGSHELIVNSDEDDFSS
jgi:hypothetical protein